ncbi:MAG: ATP-binding cassette domain-containing protein [Armatimonadota bacterium]|nr:ATP-binding cassette domain-containing protein [Armatimonadota bacterium]MDR7439608.1 ATP-binding cassette domain-containing protein [Armatimonadota bacterium]MDR7562833.1 ATP-binding cassette domain-containing protein [Armatimonadota bacterium]MDR7568926.1 ATP-binding cassette domain-containing protein [Armatimonadota bacterium]MDR7602079.1 ATP-binding cassette domain-containing protein [Armatimonadota bacterium]
MPAVEAVRLTRRFGDLVAVDGLDLTVPARTVFGLLGPNGAGKSTTVKMLTTLLEPTSGEAQVAGWDIVREAHQVRRCIGYVPQMLSADGLLTGYENLLISAKLYGIPRKEREQRVEEALRFMGLLEAAHVLVRNYSGGMIRRLEIAQAMLHRPQVLFLDEPTVGLDPVARRAVWGYVRELRDRFGTTVVLTTHDMEEADELCDLVAILHRGRLAALGRPAELKARVGSEATLDDVFAHFTGGAITEGGTFRDVIRTRRTARRLG